jgi:uncharacterized protein YgiM (DUF1202 family)
LKLPHNSQFILSLLVICFSEDFQTGSKHLEFSVSVELEESVNRCKQVQIVSSKKAKELENKLKDAKSIQEKALNDAENEMKELKRKSEESRSQWKQREQVL